MKRAQFAALAVFTMLAGIGVHFHGRAALGLALRDMIGDALWAMMITWIVAAVVPNARVTTRAAVALAVCFAVELSQLYHTPALDALRHSMVGHLVLGSGFDVRDLFAYAAGVLIALLIEVRVLYPPVRAPRSA